MWTRKDRRLASANSTRDREIKGYSGCRSLPHHKSIGDIVIVRHIPGSSGHRQKRNNRETTPGSPYTMNTKDREIFANLTIFPPFLSGSTAGLSPPDPRTQPQKTLIPRSREHAGGLRYILEGAALRRVRLHLLRRDQPLLPALPFSGRVEKIDSVTASVAASVLTIELGCAEPLAFDAGPSLQQGSCGRVLVSRQNEAWRNHINAYCQSALIEEGMTSRRPPPRSGACSRTRCTR